MDAETALLLECIRNRRQHGEALLLALSAALEPYTPPPPPPKLRTVSAAGWRDVGLARFKAVREVGWRGDPAHTTI